MLTYGITEADWDSMFERQGRVCAICRTSDPGSGAGGEWNTDHDHKTGRVRGILCWVCNVGIGKFEDDPERLRRAALYLEET